MKIADKGRCLNMPLTERVFLAHKEDLHQWTKETKDPELKKKYEERLERLEKLYKKLCLGQK